MATAGDSRPSPAKRRREDDLGSPPTEISKHESLYFENGTIVLLSLPKNNTITAFKVFKEFLMLYSSVFEGMFSLPLPPNTEEYDNVPFVRLHDDATELIPFLKAIYDPMAVPSKKDFYFSFDKVESVFKLSTKYQCDQLLNRMRDTLSAIWPKNLAQWDSFSTNKIIMDNFRRYRNYRDYDDYDDYSNYGGDDYDDHDDGGYDGDGGGDGYGGGDDDGGSDDGGGDDDDDGGGSWDDSGDNGNHDPNHNHNDRGATELPEEYVVRSTLPEPCSAIRLARDYNVPAILPAAFYRLFSLSPQALANKRSLPEDHWGVPFDPMPKFSYLSKDDFICFVQGGYAIQRGMIKFYEEFPKYIPPCRQGRRCYSWLRDCLEDDKARAERFYYDGLLVLDKRPLEEEDPALCYQCTSEYFDHRRRERSTLWDSLPSVFGLDTCS